ncbi:unnamed protein product, partial [Rotaria sp. Silwood1]
TTSIAIETTSTRTIPSVVSITTTPSTTVTNKPTSTASMLETSTMENVENIIISSYDQILPREKRHIAVMATIIPIVWIVFIIAVFWVKKSNGVINNILHPFTNWSRSGETFATYELSSVSHA